MAHTAHPIIPPYRLDEILKQGLSPARVFLVDKFSSRALDDTGYAEFIDRLKQATPPADLSALEEQIAVAELALGNKPAFAFKALRLDSEEERLLWAAVIGRISNSPKQYGDIGQHPAWQRVKHSDWAQLERMQNHAHLYQTTNDKNAQVGWGKPGTGFYYAPHDNHINLDLMFALIDPDYLHVYYHEEAHRLFTVEFPKSITDEREKLIGLDEIQKQRTLSPAEAQQVIEAETRSQLRMIFFNALEDNMADMASVKRFEHERRTDAEGAALRHDVVTGKIGQNAAKYDEAVRAGNTPQPDPQPSLQKQWMNLLLAGAASMAMRREFGFLPNNEEGWRRIGVEPGWLEAKGDRPGDPAITGMDALNLLQDYARRIGDEQPQPELYADPAALKREAHNCVKKRNAIIEEVFDRFGGRLMEQLVKERKEQAQQEQKPQAPGDAHPEGGSSIESGSSQVIIEIPPATPREAARQAAAQQGSHEGDNPSLEQLAQQAEQREAERELERLLKEAQNKAPPQANDNPQGKPMAFPGKPAMDENRAGAMLGALDHQEALQRRGSLNEYQKMALQRTGTTDDIAQLLEEIQKRQVELVSAPQGLGKVPQRQPINVNAHARLKIAQEMGEVREHHYNRFPQQEITRQPPLMKIVGLFDGSGSVSQHMNQIIGAGCALNEAVNKVNRLSPRPSIGFHMNLWGAQKAVTIAAPGDEAEDIAKGIEAARQCRFSSSNLAPALAEFLKTATGQDTQRGPARLQAMASNVGMSHLFIVSDGDLDDLPNAKKALRAILEQCEKVTVDVVIIDNDHDHFNIPQLAGQGRTQTNMDRLIAEAKAEFGDRVSVTHAPPARIEKGMLKAMNTRLELCREEKAIPYHEAIRQYAAALDEIEPKRRSR